MPSCARGGGWTPVYKGVRSPACLPGLRSVDVWEPPECFKCRGKRALQGEDSVGRTGEAAPEQGEIVGPGGLLGSPHGMKLVHTLPRRQVSTGPASLRGSPA